MAAPASTYPCQGCIFVPLGARAATSKIDSTVAAGTGVGRNRRIELREVIARSKTLASLRPYASMLVIAHNEDYIEAMLAALRA